MVEIIPAILEKDWQGLERKINLVKSFASTIQIDIIDGEFAPFKTFLDSKPFAKYSKDLFLELHLMVKNPLNYLKPFAESGFKRFIAHVEALPQLDDQEEFIAQGKIFGEVGLALDDLTGIDSLKIPLNNLDCLLVMLVKAGSSGQHFNLANIEKIKQLREKTQIAIEADGGINLESIVKAKEAGATRFSVNSFLYSAQSPQERYNLLHNQ
jgi:ribulose-phosphate 3-epimerase